MTDEAARKRLCQVILGSTLSSGPPNAAVVSIPVLAEDITESVLLAATEAIYSFTPEHVRQVLPLVLHSLETKNAELIGSGYFDTFFFHVNYEFHKPTPGGSIQVIDGNVIRHPRYVTDYRQNWTASTVSAMNRFEQGWAYDWASDLLRTRVVDAGLNAREDVTMFCRILGMAIGKPVDEVPAFEMAEC